MLPVLSSVNQTSPNFSKLQDVQFWVVSGLLFEIKFYHMVSSLDRFISMVNGLMCLTLHFNYLSYKILLKLNFWTLWVWFFLLLPYTMQTIKKLFRLFSPTFFGGIYLHSPSALSGVFHITIFMVCWLQEETHVGRKYWKYY